MDVRCVGVALLAIVAVCAANDALVFKAEEISWNMEADILRSILSWRTVITRPFHWKDCGGYGGHVLSLSVTPDPIKLPGEISFSVHVEVNITVVAPLKGQLTIEKKVFDRYIKLPYVDNFGSCTYDDICSMLPSGPCPPVLAKHGIPCHCPVQPGVYSLPPTSVSAPKVPFLPGGDYRITGALFDTEAKSIGCLQLELSISK